MLESSSRVDSATRKYVDSRGEFQVLPIADARCAASESGETDIYNTGYGTCIVSDSSRVMIILILNGIKILMRGFEVKPIVTIY